MNMDRKSSRPSITEWRSWGFGAISLWFVSGFLVQGIGHFCWRSLEPSAMADLLRIFLLIVAILQTFVLLSSMTAQRQRQTDPDREG